MQSCRTLLVAVVVLGFAALVAGTGKGEEPSAKKAQSATPDTRKRVEVPEGGVKEMLAFIEEMNKNKPGTVPGSYAAMRKATERIVRLATEEDKKLPGYNDAIGMHFRFRTTDAVKSAAARIKLRDDLKTYFAETAEPSDHAFSAARSLCGILEYGENPRGAIPLYRELGAALARHDDERAAKVGRRLLGTARRLGLIGESLEISGTRIDGTKFDWEKLRGKVVLVDFWATWCTPCTKEFPHIKRHYEQYHDKGFEVVGISVDEDRQALDTYLAKETIPWVTLHDGGFEDSPLAIDYGLSGIPTTLLVDRQGTVVSLDARGDELDRKLAELLGPAEN
ncbi:MAG: TlpA disulfide reductase family protein [Pirellulales bacterium]